MGINFKELQKNLRSIIKSLEVFYVVAGDKPCSRILLHEDELEKVIVFLKEFGLYIQVSDFKVAKRNTQSEFYSDLSIKLPNDANEKGYLFVYLSKDKRIAIDAKLAEQFQDHKKLGMLLGYPKCCREFFDKNFGDKDADLTLKTLENSQGFAFPFYTNIGARHFDMSLLGHFPHSFDCEPSIDIARNNLKTLKENFPALADFLVRNLSAAVVYTSNDGIFLLTGHRLEADELNYSEVFTTTKSKLYYIPSSNNKLKIIDKNSFIVNDIAIHGKEYGVMVFNEI